MLALALGWAEVLGARDLVIGVNAIDYSGYPDCRPEFIRSFEALAALATKAGVEGARFKVHAPLIAMSKAQIIRSGLQWGVDYAMTVSCYQADARRPRLRAVRFLPPATRGLCRGRRQGSDALPLTLQRCAACVLFSVSCAAPRVGSSVGRAAPF